MATITENKKVRYNYDILEKHKAGISLKGTEVKAIRAGKINILRAFVVIRAGEAYLVGARIPPYQPKNAPLEYNPERSRKLLLRKEEIRKLIGKSSQKGLTLKPLSVYTDKGKIKIELAVIKAKKKYDKREKIKQREAEREMRKEARREA